jgi:inhibitor of cysteine peptidase
MSRAYRATLAGLAVAGLVVVAGCAGKKVYGADTSSIETTVGQDIVIALESNPTTGYSWQVGGRVDSAIVAQISSDYEPSPSTALGAGGYQRWTFRAVGRGTTTIRLDYARPWVLTPPLKSTTFTLVIR